LARPARTGRPDRQAQGESSNGGRPPAFDPDIYKKRNVVERCFARLKQFRGLATRYAKRVAYYRAEVIIALWLRDFTGEGLALG